MEGELGLVATSKLKEICRRIERDPSCGKPLGGELKGCRSLRIEGENRIIYREKHLDDGTICEVIAIGRRRDGTVHGTAGKRKKKGHGKKK